MLGKQSVCALLAIGLLLFTCGCVQDAKQEEETTVSTSKTDTSASSTEKETSGQPTKSSAVKTKKTTTTTTAATTTAATATETTKVPTTTAPTTYTLTPVDASQYYGLSLLKKMEHSDALVSAYQKFVAAAEAGTEIIPMDGTLTGAEIAKVFFYYRADHPQHFWVEGKITHTDQDGLVMQARLTFNMSGNELASAKQKFQTAVNELLSIAATGKTEYDREKLLHDAIAERVVYRDGSHSHTAYGALVDKTAVCEGYARAFQYLLYQSGIQCLIAEGSSINPSTGKEESHAWNVVKIDGQYYHVDLTWDDANHDTVTVMYPYFNMTTEQIQNHGHKIVTDKEYPLPQCTATAANYHVKNGSRLTAYTVDAVTQLLKNDPNGAHIFIAENRDAFPQWLNNNMRDIATKIGITTGFSYKMLNIGSEFVVWLIL